MKLQACRFKRKRTDDWETGVAAVKSFCVSDIDYIIDGSGGKIPEVWDYHLTSGPLQYLDTDYQP